MENVFFFFFSCRERKGGKSGVNKLPAMIVIWIKLHIQSRSSKATAVGVDLNDGRPPAVHTAALRLADFSAPAFKPGGRRRN